MNILMIDDDSHVRRLLIRPLEKHGHAVAEAHNGQQGWDLFAKYPDLFDVIITDIEMPEMDGIELLKRLRERQYTVPVIVMTAYKDIDYSIQMLRLGASDFLLKPFQIRNLLDSLERIESLRVNKKKAFEKIEIFSEHISIVIPSQPYLIPNVVSILQDRIQFFCEFYQIDIRNISVCLHEALANAVIHGNLDVSSAIKNESPEQFDQLVRERELEPEFGHRQISISCEISSQALKFQIQDEGRGFDHEAFRPSDPTLLLPSGRGILIMRAFMDEVLWNEIGNCVTLIKTLPQR